MDIGAGALTLRHLAAHKPKLKSCPTCQRAKAVRVKHINKNKKAKEMIPRSIDPVPENFGDEVILDKIIARSIRNLGFRGQTAALAMLDRATGFQWGKAQVQKTGDANLEALQRFQAPDAKDKIKYVW
jgi:hypothetical protein